jgi:hypothetical protein
MTEEGTSRSENAQGVEAGDRYADPPAHDPALDAARWAPAFEGTKPSRA